MLVYLVGLVVAVWYAVVARQSRGHVLGWPVLGVAAFFGAYRAWIALLGEHLVRDVDAMIWFVLAGMLVGSAASIIILALLVRSAAARTEARTDIDGSSMPRVNPLEPNRRQYLRLSL